MQGNLVLERQEFSKQEFCLIAHVSNLFNVFFQILSLVKKESSKFMHNFMQLFCR